MTAEEKVIFSLLEANSPIALGALKTEAGLSNKKWDKSMKGLSKLGLVKVEVNGDEKLCVLQA